MLFRFLCMLWGYTSNHGDQLDAKVGAVLQTRALYMGGALLITQPASKLKELAAANSPGEIYKNRKKKNVTNLLKRSIQVNKPQTNVS